METDELSATLIRIDEIVNGITDVKHYLEDDIALLKKTVDAKDAEIKRSKEELDIALHALEGNRQLINKLLGDMSKLQNDIEWYKRTYEQRSFLGTVSEKIFNKRKSID